MIHSDDEEAKAVEVGLVDPCGPAVRGTSFGAVLTRTPSEDRIMDRDKMRRWDRYFLQVCEAVSRNSPCMSIQRGAILVRDKSIVSTGYNGPPRGVPHCGQNRFAADDRLRRRIASDVRIKETGRELHHRIKTICPRQILGYKSGQGLDWCFAAHAEKNCLINAARLGVITLGTTLYTDSVIPCKDCLIGLINAGVCDIVVKKLEHYNDIQFLLETTDLILREFYT